MFIVVGTVLYTVLIAVKLIPFLYDTESYKYFEAYLFSIFSLIVFGVDAWRLNPVGYADVNVKEALLHKVHSAVLVVLGIVAWLHFRLLIT